MACSFVVSLGVGHAQTHDLTRLPAISRRSEARAASKGHSVRRTPRERQAMVGRPRSTDSSRASRLPVSGHADLSVGLPLPLDSVAAVADALRLANSVGNDDGARAGLLAAPAARTRASRGSSRAIKGDVDAACPDRHFVSDQMSLPNGASGSDACDERRGNRAPQCPARRDARPAGVDLTGQRVRTTRL